MQLTIRRVSLHADAMSISSGHVAKGFEPVREAFERNFEDDLELGAGFAAFVGEEKIVDLFGGYMDRARTQPWTDQTICPIYSTTKPTAALVIATLVDRGMIDYDAPLAGYWPEFAANGKGGFTVAEVLSHQGGLPGFPDPVDPNIWLDPRATADALAEMAPMWKPGEGSGYHPLTWGYIAGELVGRVDGRSLGTVLKEDICAPLGVDYRIGTPDSEHPRCAQMMKPKEITKFGERNDALKAAFLSPWSAPNRSATEWRRVEIPSANGHGTAAAVAEIYSAFARKGMIDGKRIISEQTWNELSKERVSGPDRILPGRVAFGAGVMRNLPLIYGPNPETLCHSGWGGSGAFGDPATGLAAAYVMNRQGSHLLEDARRSRIIDALYACL